MKNNKTGLLSMCRKAGKTVLGMDMVKVACSNGEAKAVFTAGDLSDKSFKEVKYICARFGIKLYLSGLTMDEIGCCLGKRIGVLAVTDAGFAKSLAKGLEQVDTEI